MPVGLETCLRHGERSEPGGKSTTKNDRTAVWGTGRRESLREKWRHTAAVLPPPGRKKGSRKSYHYVRGVRGQVSAKSANSLALRVPAMRLPWPRREERKSSAYLIFCPSVLWSANQVAGLAS